MALAHATPLGRARDTLRRFFDGDVFHSFSRSPITIVAFVVTVGLVLAACLAPWIAPHDTTDQASLDLMNARLPPAWKPDGRLEYLLGTDDQGRDVLSTIMFGMRISLLVGFASVALALVVGVALGLISGFYGGRLDAAIMRVADVQLSFPAILIALMIDGISRGLEAQWDWLKEQGDEIRLYVLILAIGLSLWVQFARTVRGSVLVEKGKEYVQAARVIGLSSGLIMVRHVLPNVLGPVLVIATLNLAVAVLSEATLSFLGIGIPPTSPSLGTLIRIGNNNLFAGEWWMAIFPGVALVILVLAVNLLGDWLRDALNPKLR